MITISFLDSSGSQEVIALDATISEAHESSVQVTDHPVETGANVSDHVRPLPRTLKLEAQVTDYPLPTVIDGFNAQAGVSSKRNVTSPGRAYTIFGTLKTLQRSGTFVSVRTGLEFYSKLVIQNVTPVRNKDTGIGALRLSIELREIVTVSSQTAPVAPKVAVMKAPVNTGKQTASDATGGEVNRSWAASTEDGIRSMFGFPAVPEALKKGGVQ